MAHPRVQVRGDVAVLSDNDVGPDHDKDGKTTPAKARSTRGYAAHGGMWMLVHANFRLAPAADRARRETGRRERRDP